VGEEMVFPFRLSNDNNDRGVVVVVFVDGMAFGGSE